MALSWKSQQFQKLLESVFPSSVSACVITPDGSPLHLQYIHLADIGTLPLAARTAQQYLQLKPGQIAIMNDPYSGGTLLSTITLITGVSLTNKTPDKSDLLLAYRFPLRPHLKFAATVDEEGLRVPPTPICENNEINKPLLKTMADHPQAPAQLFDKTIEAISSLQTLAKNFITSFEIYELGFSKVLVQNYLAESHKIMKTVVGEFPLGDAFSLLTLKDETRMKVHVETTGDKILMDFTGTSSNKKMNLTDSATFGACFGALVSLFDQPLPINAGSFQILEVRTPSGTLLNAKYPAPTFLGMTDGVALTANLVLRALGEIIPKKQVAATYPGQCALDLEFEGGLHFFDTVAPGTGASVDGKGEDGIHFWARSPLQASIEDIEKRFPVRITNLTIRNGSGGKGQFKGGDGLIKTYELLSPAFARWALGPSLKMEGIDGGTAGAEPEILITRKGGSKEKAETYGNGRFEAGDIITIHSAGGCSFGHSKS
jgi:N-methylhydantoinase B